MEKFRLHQGCGLPKISRLGDEVLVSQLNISQIAQVFELSRPTVRRRLKVAGVMPVGRVKNIPVYKMSQVGPALFAKNQWS